MNPDDPSQCANCGRSFSEHCTIHLIPCCPGKCGTAWFKDEGIKGMVRNPDHDTSEEAAHAVNHIKKKLQREIYEELKREPMTDEQLERLERFANYGQTTVSKRRTELYQKGLVVSCGRSKNSHGKYMKVWKAI